MTFGFSAGADRLPPEPAWSDAPDLLVFVQENEKGFGDLFPSGRGWQPIKGCNQFRSSGYWHYPTGIG